MIDDFSHRKTFLGFEIGVTKFIIDSTKRAQVYLY